jgi:hypothetical protein
MDENGAPQTVINGAFYLDGSKANFKVTEPSNIANSAVSSNIWSFNLEDDQGTIGAAFEFVPTAPCNFMSAPPRITSFFSSNSFVMSPGNFHK